MKDNIKKLVLILGFLGLASILTLSQKLRIKSVSDNPEIGKYSPTKTIEASEFILMGDTGTGSEAQYNVAGSIKNYCATKSCKAVFILGDVIYEEGVKNVNDEQFMTKFETPYKDINLPFYILFGNHDYLGCSECYLEYDRVSSKWEMPARYYIQKYDFISSYALDTENFDSEQQQWLDQTLNNDSSIWKIVLGHSPLKTFEETKMNENWKGKNELKNILCNSADFYVSGHSHILEDPGNVEGCKVRQLTSGSGGSYPREVKKPYEGEFYFEDNGFLVLTLESDSIKLEFFDENGKSLYQLTSQK